MIAEETNLQCPLCGSYSASFRDVGPLAQWLQCNCKHCGPYSISDQATDTLGPVGGIDRVTLAAFVRERTLRTTQPIKIFFSDEEASKATESQGGINVSIGQVKKDYPLPAIADRLDRSLLNLSLREPLPGKPVIVSENDISCFYVEAAFGVAFMLRQLGKESLIESEDLPGGVGLEKLSKVEITAKGWSRIASLQNGKLGALSKKAFVAMWFDPSMNPAYHTGIKPAIERAGFEPFRVDMNPSNDQLTDQIITNLRSSRFVVVEVSGERPSVYYEAGFMHGLGRPVIFCSRSSEKLHFDTRQYPHIIWEDPAQLAEALYNRIKATIV